MIFSENTWLIVWTSKPIEFLEFSPVRPRISRRPLFNDSGSEVRYIRRCGVVSLEIPEMGEGSTAHVLIDGFRYVDVEFEWLVIKRGKGKGGRKREKMCAFLAKFPSSK